MSVVSGIMGASASKSAASDQANASAEASAATLQATREAIASQETLAREGIAFQQAMLEQSRADTAPWRVAGENALTKLLGTQGVNNRPNPKDFMKKPVDNTAEVQSNFQTLLGRNPQPEGLDYYKKSGLTGPELTQAITDGAAGNPADMQALTTGVKTIAQLQKEIEELKAMLAGKTSQYNRDGGGDVGGDGPSGNSSGDTGGMAGIGVA